MKRELSTEEMVYALRISNPMFVKYTVKEFMKFCSVGEFEIVKKTRKKEICFNRQIACVFALAQGLTLKEAGDVLGGLNHTTVINAVKKVYYSDLYDSNLHEYMSIFKDSIRGMFRGFSSEVACSAVSLEYNFHNQNK